MKKVLLSLITVVLTCAAIAQGPIIDGAFLPVNNTEIKQIYNLGNLQLLFIPAAGENVTWDYSTAFPIDPINSDTFMLRTLHPDSAAPYNGQFGTATHSTFLRVPFNSVADSLYSFFRIDTVGLHGVGIRSLKKQTVMAGYNVKLDTAFISNPEEFVMPFTVAYGDSIPDSSIAVGDIQVEFGGNWYNTRITTTKVKELLAIGHGTLMHPTGMTYTEVLLGKEIIRNSDYLEVDLAGTGTYTPIDQLPFPLNGLAQPVEDTIIKYHFLRNNTFASTHLLLIETDASDSISYGWYTIPSNTGSISGTCLDSNGTPMINGEMRLYREYSNFTKNDVLARTEAAVDGTWQFDSIPFGYYRIAVKPRDDFYPRAMTTYVGNTVDWESADTIITTGDVSGLVINLLYSNAPNQSNFGGTAGGNGNLNNTINKMQAAAGDPVPGIDISLEQIPGGIIGNQVETDSLGNFLLDSLQPGTYRMFVDVPGKHHASTHTFTVVDGDSIIGLDFTIGFDSVHVDGTPSTIQLDTTGQATESYFYHANTQHEVAIYPNPFSNQLKIEVILTDENDLTLDVYDLVGRNVKSFNFSSVDQKYHSILWDSSDLPKGAYIVSLKSNGNEFAKKKIIKN